MKVLVCGGRNYADRDHLNAELDRLHAERGFTQVIAGGARGADTLAEEWAKARGLPCDVYRADWKGLGRKAGPIRNERMLHEGRPALVVAFEGGRGTAHMCRIAREAGVEVIEIPIPVPANYLAFARMLGATEEEARDSLRHPRISFELPRVRSSKRRKQKRGRKPKKAY